MTSWVQWLSLPDSSIEIRIEMCLKCERKVGDLEFLLLDQRKEPSEICSKDMLTAEWKQPWQGRNQWKLMRESNILLYPDSLVEFVKCYCLRIAGFGELETGPRANSETLERPAIFGMTVLFMYNKMPGQKDKQPWEWIIGNMSFPPAVLEIFQVGNIRQH